MLAKSAFNVFVLAFGCLLVAKITCAQTEYVKANAANANDNENEISSKIGHLINAEQALEAQDYDPIVENQHLSSSEVPEWKLELLKRALPRMGKRMGNDDSSSSEIDQDMLNDDDLYELYYKRALPRMGRALPRMGRALPRMGRAAQIGYFGFLRRLRALPRMG